MTESSAERAQGDKGPVPLFRLLGEGFAICALWLLALVLTESINSALTPLDDLAYTFVFLTLAVMLLLVGVLVSTLFGKRGERGFENRSAGVLEQGHARIREWTERSTRRSIIYRGGLGAAIAIVGMHAARSMTGAGQDEAGDFSFWLVLIVAGFGFGVIWLLLASLIAGLWPERSDES